MVFGIKLHMYIRTPQNLKIRKDLNIALKHHKHWINSLAFDVLIL